MGRLLAELLVGFISNKEKDYFTIRLGAALTLSRFGITGVPATILGWFLRSAMGLIVSVTAMKIDLGLDKLEEGMKMEEFKKEAKKAYDEATARAYTEEEKRAIRKKYLDILDRATAMGRVPKSP